MDFAATLRVLARHKLLVAFLLVVTLGGTAWVLTSAAKTEQAAGSYVLLSAPRPQAGADGKVPVANNPFSDMDQSTVVDVLVRSMATEQIANELKEEGLIGQYRVAGNQDFIRGPLFDIFVTSPTSEEALAGYELLSTKLADTLEERQIEAGADPSYLISMQRVSSPVLSTPGLVGRIRTGITLLAAGTIVTVGLVLVVDSLSQRRRRRKADAMAEEQEAFEAEHPSDEPARPRAARGAEVDGDDGVGGDADVERADEAEADGPGRPPVASGTDGAPTPPHEGSADQRGAEGRGEREASTGRRPWSRVSALSSSSSEGTGEPRRD